MVRAAVLSIPGNPTLESPQVRAPTGRLRQVLAMILLFGLPMAAQSPGKPTMLSHPQQSPFADPYASDNPESAIDARRVKLLNAIRQKAMVSDAEKLLTLARELDADARSDSATLSSAERVHKASEIERLARDVKEKMTFAVGTPIDPLAPSSTWRP